MIPFSSKIKAASETVISLSIRTITFRGNDDGGMEATITPAQKINDNTKIAAMAILYFKIKSGKLIRFLIILGICLIRRFALFMSVNLTVPRSFLMANAPRSA